MVSIAASFVGLIGAFCVASYLIVRWQRRLVQQQRTVSKRLDELHSLLTATRQELEWLKARACAVASDTDHRLAGDPLEQIEQLADPALLATSTALDDAVKQIATMPAGVAADLFTADHKNLAISRLLEKGHSLREISRRLNIPIGEIELLTSIRS